MDAALSRLLWLRLYGGIRSRLIELRTVRGFVFMAITIVLFGWVGYISSLRLDQLPQVADIIGTTDSLKEHVDRFVPVALLGIALFSVFTASGPALFFSPAEINLLFSAPITRRGLLLYKVIMYATGALLSAGLMALLVSTENSATIFVTIFMTLMFKQLFSITVGMGIQATRPYLFAHWQRYAVGALAVLVAAVIAARVWGGGTDVIIAWDELRQTTAIRAVLAPFVPFARLLASRGDPEAMLFWVLVTMAINGLLVVLLLKLDRITSESSLAADEARNRRWKRTEDSGRLQSSGDKSARSRRPVHALGGMGAMAWRQWVTATRDSARTVVFFLCLMAGCGLLLTGWNAVLSLHGKLAVIILIAVFFLPRSMVFDFRADIKNIERFKALPLSPWRICLGQLTVPVLLTSVMEFVLIVCAQINVPSGMHWVGNILILFLIPFNFLLYAIENLTFLLVPTRLVPVGRMDFEFIGRSLVDLGIKSAVLIAACANAAFIGGIVASINGRSITAFAVTSWTVLMASGLLLLPLLAHGFSRYDVSARGTE